MLNFSIFRFFKRSFLWSISILLFWIPPIRRKITQHLNEPPPVTEAHAAAIGLTVEELKSVQNSWALVNANLIQNGIDLLNGLFAAYPDYKNLFKQFRGKSLDEIKGSPMLRAHGTAFMHGMCAFVENLTDKDTLIRLIHDNVERHIPRNVTYQQYKNVFGLVPGFLEQKLGPKLDGPAASGWNKIINLMCDVINQKYQDIERELTV